MRQIRIHRFLIALLPLTLAACISSSPSARFYTLHADISGVDPGSQALGDDWVGVGPIDVPDYLDRPQIVTRGDGHRLIIHEFDRWADPVAPYPWPSTFRPSRRMMGEITAFEARPAGDVLLRVRWLISIPGDRENEEIHVGEYVEPAAPGDFDAMAEAMSRALERWSRDIASALSESVANDRE